MRTSKTAHEVAWPGSHGKAHAEIRNQLRDEIMRQHLAPGDKLPTEEALAERLGVSRPAVREALRSMEALGMVRSRQGSGRVLREFNFDAIIDHLEYGFAFHNRSILDLTEIRLALDEHFVDSVIAKATPADLRFWRASVEHMRRREHRGEPVRVEDETFHRRYYAVAGNALAGQLFEIAWKVKFNVYDSLGWWCDNLPGQSDRHAAIVDAVAAHDAQAARVALREHYADMLARLEERMQVEARPPRNGKGGPPAARSPRG